MRKLYTAVNKLKKTVLVRTVVRLQALWCASLTLTTSSKAYTLIHKDIGRSTRQWLGTAPTCVQVFCLRHPRVNKLMSLKRNSLPG